MKELLKKQRQLVAVYAVWFFINLVVLFMSFVEKGSNYCKRQFWPFDACDLTESYDFSEFLVYAIGPAILIFAYLMFTKKD